MISHKDTHLCWIHFSQLLKSLSISICLVWTDHYSGWVKISFPTHLHLYCLPCAIWRRCLPIPLRQNFHPKISNNPETNQTKKLIVHCITRKIFKQESIPIECVSSAYSYCTCINRPSDVSNSLCVCVWWGGACWSEQVWTGLQWWPPDVTSRGRSLSYEIPCSGGGPFPVMSNVCVCGGVPVQ